MYQNNIKYLMPNVANTRYTEKKYYFSFQHVDGIIGAI